MSTKPERTPAMPLPPESEARGRLRRTVYTRARRYDILVLGDAACIGVRLVHHAGGPARPARGPPGIRAGCGRIGQTGETPMGSRTLLAAVSIAATLGLAVGASAQLDGGLQTLVEGAGRSSEPDPLVALVNGERLYRSDVLAAGRGLPPEYLRDIDKVFDALLDRAVDLKLLSIAGRRNGLASDPKVMDAVRKVEDEMIREVFVERLVETEIDEDALYERYEDYLERNPPRLEIHARHILLESERAARDVIAELDDGADFDALARTRSIAPSAPKGGDLGYFTQDYMVPEFSAAAFALDPGEYTEDPVKTGFGWHVILVEDKREMDPVTFEGMKEELRVELSKERLQAILTTLRRGAVIQEFDGTQMRLRSGTAGKAPGTN
jgi:peptidyl-prolyl cis-trans isomerase C